MSKNKIALVRARDGDPRYVYCWSIRVNEYIACEIEIAGDRKAQALARLKRFIAGKGSFNACGIARCRWTLRQGEDAGEYVDIMDGVAPHPIELKRDKPVFQYREDF